MSSRLDHIDIGPLSGQESLVVVRVLGYVFALIRQGADPEALFGIMEDMVEQEATKRGLTLPEFAEVMRRYHLDG